MEKLEDKRSQVRVLVCDLEDQDIKRAWKALSTKSAAEASDALEMLMMYCSEVNYWPCQPCESRSRAWYCLWEMLRDKSGLDGRRAGGNPYDAVLDLPHSWPQFERVIDWVKKFRGADGEAVTWLCPYCAQSVSVASVIISAEVEFHKAEHRDHVRDAILGMTAGDPAGFITELLSKMAKARSNLKRAGYDDLKQEYQRWIQDLDLFSKGSGFEHSENSSVGACVACVIALDPAVDQSTTLTTLSQDLAESLGCGKQATSAAVVNATSCRRAIRQIAKGESSQLQGIRDDLLDADLAITMADGGRAPEGVVRLARRPEEIRSEALSEKHDDAKAVLLAARHFQDISLHFHRTLTRLFSWGGDAHVAGIIAGFQAGVKYGAEVIKDEWAQRSEPGRMAEMDRVAGELANLWVPSTENGS